MKSEEVTPVILVDDREKLPLPMPNARVQRLATADYSLENLTEVVAVERKSLVDLYGCIGQNRENFELELERLAKFPYPAIVIEANFPDLLIPPPHSDVHPHSAVGSLIAWSVKHRIPVWLAGDRRMATSIVHKILTKALKYSQS
jgi:ERCC4-type nuclease